MLQNKLLVEENSDLRQKIKCVNKEAASLKKAETIYIEKTQKFFHYLSFYRNIYSKYLNLLSLIPKPYFKELSLNRIPPTPCKNSYTNEDIPFDSGALDRRVKALVKKDKEKSKSFNKTNQEIEEMLAQEISLENPNSSKGVKKQKYLGYLKKIAHDFSEFIEKNKNNDADNRREEKNKIIHVNELISLQKAKAKRILFRNNSEIILDTPQGESEFLELMSIRQNIQQKINDRRELNISKISKESEEWDLNLSFLHDNINDVSQTGEILVMNKFQNPFRTNFQGNYQNKNFLMAKHTKVSGKLYSPLSKINPDIKEASFEHVDQKKLNMSFMSNGDEIFF